MGPLMDSVHLHHRISREARPRVACHAACTARLAAARLGCLAVGQRSCRSCSLASLSRTLSLSDALQRDARFHGDLNAVLAFMAHEPMAQPIKR